MNPQTEFKLNKNGLFFKLKNHSVIQSTLISSLLNKYNCSIADLALILHTDVKSLESALLEETVLSEEKAEELVFLFYSLFKGLETSH